MTLFTFGVLFLLVAILVFIATPLAAAAANIPNLAVRVLAGIGIVIGAILILLSTAIFVSDGEGGVVKVTFGADKLEPGQIVATDGEMGPQAEVLPPGWHFGYWPFVYELEAVPIEVIPQGMLGVVTANDGKPLPEGQIYAPEWESPDAMLDGQKFLTGGTGDRSEGEGVKGPQLTVLKPGKYRYNPILFKIEQHPVTEVSVGTVAVIKANAGDTYRSEEGERVETVNGVPIVPNGHRGIWARALTPDAYYLHPGAYIVTEVATTNRVYAYSDADAIDVRTKDGFEFPVDVRVSVKISAENAPYVVAKLSNPDAQAPSGYTVLEERVILPLVRAIFRNTAESRNALQFVNLRSEIESVATEELRKGLEEFRIDTDGVFVADIRIGETEAGRELLRTQTEREVALNQQETYAEKERAQRARAEAVRAEEEANQEVQQAQARSRVVIAQEDAKAAIAKAEGEAEAFRKKIDALGGVDRFVQLEIVNRVIDRWSGAIPSVLVAGSGQGGGSIEALVASMLEESARRRAPDGE